jgi:hypothetical protein
MVSIGGATVDMGVGVKVGTRPGVNEGVSEGPAVGAVVTLGVKRIATGPLGGTM